MHVHTPDGRTKKIPNRRWALALALRAHLARRVRRCGSVGPRLGRLPPLLARETGTGGFEPGVSPDRWWSADTAGWHAVVASDERPRGTPGYSTWLGDGWDESPSRIP